MKFGSENMTRKQIVFIVCILLIVELIWINSSLPVQQSRAQSGSVQQVLNWIISRLGSSVTLSVHLVRKFAHIVEYSLLGSVTALFVIIFFTKIRWYHIWNAFSFVLIVAVVDESIQILSGRGPLISDVLIDMGSAIMATMLLFTANWLIRRLRRKRTVDS